VPLIDHVMWYTFVLVAVTCRTRPSGYDEDGQEFRANPFM